MDIQMPVMDGYTATQVIRNDLKMDIPVIAMKAHAMAGEREKCLSFGMNEYISKPIREEQLYRLIRQFITTADRNDNKKTDQFSAAASAYNYIDLQYMKAVSAGNKEYEKLVTEQFLEAIPEDLQQIEN